MENEEVCIKLDKELVQYLLKQTGLKTVAELTQETFTVFKWLVQEVEAKRLVFTCNGSGSELLQFTPNWDSFKGQTNLKEEGQIDGKEKDMDPTKSE